MGVTLIRIANKLKLKQRNLEMVGERLAKDRKKVERFQQAWGKAPVK